MKFAQTNYTVAVTVRCFGAFRSEYCCSDSILGETFLFNCCSDSFVGKLKNFIRQFFLFVFRFEEKNCYFFFQFIGMLTLWLDDR